MKSKNMTKNKDQKSQPAKNAGNQEKEFWDTTLILQGQKHEDILKDIEKNTKKFEELRAALKENIQPQELKKALILKDTISADIGRAYAYWDLKHCENTADERALSELDHIKQIATDVSNRTLFFSLWLMHLDEKNAQRLIDAKELLEFRHYLIRVRVFKKYTLSEDVEQLLNIKNMTGGEALADLYRIITNSFVYEFQGKRLTQEEVTAHFKSADPKLREEAYKSVLGKYKENSLVLSQIYKNIALDWYNEDIKIRKYSEPITPRNMGNDVDDRAVEALLKVVKKNAKMFSEYFRLKYEMNKKKGEKYPYSRYHLYAPLSIKVTKKYPYQQSKNYSLETYRMFDERIYLAAKQIFDKRCVHSHPQQGKRSGAFCYNITNRLPPYVLLNHTGELRDLFTMMHELGHGIHDVLSQKQPNLLQHAGLPMAETASIFGEMLLADRLLKESRDDEEKKYILTKLLDNQYASIGRQAYFVLFEKLAHSRITGTVTKEELDKEYEALLKEQFGDMQLPDEFRHEWNYIPHIHESPFYCYAYAWGNLLVLALFDMYRKEGKPFAEKYIRLLSTGGSKSAADMLKEIGIDPSKEEFWQRGFDIIKEEIEELKRLK